MSKLKFSVQQTVLVHNNEGKVVRISTVANWTHNTAWVDGVSFSAITGKRVKSNSTTFAHNRRVTDIYSEGSPRVSTHELYSFITPCELQREMVDDVRTLELEEYTETTDVSELIEDIKNLSYGDEKAQFRFTGSMLLVTSQREENDNELFYRVYAEPEFNRQAKVREEKARQEEIAQLEARLAELKG